MPKFDITLTQRSGKPKVEPNPLYPNGIDLDGSGGRTACKVTLPYPAEERGVWAITCSKCGSTMGVTAAGRRDDPRSVMMPCKSS